jgi:DNA primase
MKMENLYSKDRLKRLRNDIPIATVIGDILVIPSKISEGYFRFLCPKCKEFNTATNPKTNLGRCFRCETNYNPIDIVMADKNYNFKEAVEFLDTLRKI